MKTAYQENAADELELALGEELAAQDARDQLRRDREQLATQQGRAWVFERLERCGVFQDIRGEVADVYGALGRRREGLELLARCQQHPDLFFQMWSEALKRRRERREYVASARKQRKAMKKAA